MNLLRFFRKLFKKSKKAGQENFAQWQNMLNKLPHISHYVDMLTHEQKGEFVEAFEIYDSNSDGSITADELGTVMRLVGENPTENELVAIIAEWDIDGNGKIELSEFLHLMAKKYVERDIQSDIKEAFRLFDRNGDGMISAHEFRYVMTHMGCMCSPHEVDQMLAEADMDGDGHISKTEFYKMIIA